jgi:hypothetical protein
MKYNLGYMQIRRKSKITQQGESIKEDIQNGKG